jgi:hypothetical protein
MQNPGNEVAIVSKIGTGLVFYSLKLPAMMVLMISGLILDFLVQLPFMIGLYIDSRFKNIK